ncbi:uncharacterized protein LY79DRAFT_544827 [Colletotrichum navitas]|uniref:Uncharacterized protein n=1 Tax=Colletotrichum navitas TaxID=681940 RepID=A0AAD8Q661_9PEZI|nr:uncharacterized protein LY79DRAFT_544827 [Colletotrichum navitas]KAK1596440.1 hypothetical protein LY79DRAFT_544827 [Colletotrichum navitas]
MSTSPDVGQPHLLSHLTRFKPFVGYSVHCTAPRRCGRGKGGGGGRARRPLCTCSISRSKDTHSVGSLDILQQDAVCEGQRDDDVVEPKSSFGSPKANGQQVKRQRSRTHLRRGQAKACARLNNRDATTAQQAANKHKKVGKQQQSTRMRTRTRSSIYCAYYVVQPTPTPTSVVPGSGRCVVS